MSCSRYLEEQVAQFRRKHPAKEGWSVHREDFMNANSETWLLPAFLRSSGQARILREDIVTVAEWRKTKAHPRRSLTEEPFKRRGEGFSEDSWVGEIDFIWKENPIHYKRFYMSSRMGEYVVTLIATRKRTALEDLWKSLRAFYKRLDPPSSRIFIVGEQAIPRPKLGWSDLVLPAGMAEDIRGNAESFLRAKKQYKEFGLAYRRGFLFAGPPGCGKTLTAKVIAAGAKAHLFLLPLKADIQDEAVDRAFRWAADCAPAILIIEDLDRLPANGKISLSYLLNLLDGFKSPEGVLFIATTNAPEKLDQALIDRPSRFDRVWHFGLPGQDERLRLLVKAGRGRFSEGALKEVSRATNGFTMAYVQEIVVNAFLRGINESRPPRDADLLESAAALRKQLKTNGKATGAIQKAGAVGFSAPQETLDNPFADDSQEPPA